MNVLPKNAALSGPLVRWAADGAAPDPTQDGQGILVQNSQVQVVRSGRPPLALRGLTSIANTESIYTIVQRPQRAYYFVSGQPGSGYAVWPQASLVWLDRSGNAVNLRPATGNFNQTAQVRDLRVVDFTGAFADPTGVGLAKAADTFNRSNAALGTATRGGAWAATGGWSIVENRGPLPDCRRTSP